MTGSIGTTRLMMKVTSQKANKGDCQRKRRRTNLAQQSQHAAMAGRWGHRKGVMLGHGKTAAGLLRAPDCLLRDQPVGCRVYGATGIEVVRHLRASPVWRADAGR
ncbi:MAG: hypothetical protein V9G14_03975 [Cypionkella sp.]